MPNRLRRVIFADELVVADGGLATGPAWRAIASRRPLRAAAARLGGVLLCADRRVFSPLRSDAKPARWLPPAAALLALSLLLGLLGARRALAAEGEGCPNAGVRVGFSALLPDCRAYELVSPWGSPPELEGLEANYVTHGSFDPWHFDPVWRTVFASVGGDAFAYVAASAPADAVSGGEYVRAVRGPAGWSSEGVSPPQSPSSTLSCPNGNVFMYSPELSRYVLGDGWGQSNHPPCGRDDPELVPGEPLGFQNLFVMEDAAGPYQLLDGSPLEGTQPANAWFEDASEDLADVLFSEHARLTGEALEAQNLYDWSSAGVQLVTRLPDGTPVEGRLAASPKIQNYGADIEAPQSESGEQVIRHAMSSDGSLVYFQAAGDLYVRVHPERPQSPVGEAGECTEPAAACTLQVDAGQEDGESGGGVFQWASSDGERVFFLDDRRLTADASALAGEPDLYEYDLEAPAGARLRDLTASSEPADVLGVSGVSDDGSYVYFVAEGALTATASATGASPVAGQPNLYVWHEGRLTFIATLAPPVGRESPADSEDWLSTEDWVRRVREIGEREGGSQVAIELGLAARVTPGGEYLAFNSQLPLTGYRNVDPASGETEDEIFLYEATSNHLACVSCDPAGAAPVASAQLDLPMEAVVNKLAGAPTVAFQQRNLADDGRVFFDTAQPLTAGAKDGVENVYEYEDGAVRLLSSGTSGLPSFFFEASPDGSDVFITTAQELPSAGENEYAVYDVREDGGFPPTAEQPCQQEECRGPLAAGGQTALPATTTLTASGNVLGVHQSVPPARPTATESRYEAELKACGRDKRSRARRFCEARARDAHRQELLKRALAACRSKHDRAARVRCEAKARRSYPASTSKRQRK